ncbi:MAG: FkbM family methyltransferase [Deferribacteres bacterium]|nr:FkbM family methyltransferase [Deferribacteres bacterium]
MSLDNILEGICILQPIKRLIKRSFLYDIYRNHVDSQLQQGWSQNDQKLLEFYSQFIKPGDLAFDVGANVGNRIKVFLKLGARVIAVEPQAYCIKFLQRKYGSHPDVTLLPKALGKAVGKAEMLISSAHTISSLSEDWVNAVQQSGRFPSAAWNKKQTVEIITLDQLVSDFGRPAFVKIDVEGYESQVISGLSKPIPALSLEFTPEYLQSVLESLDYLASFSEIKCNYYLGETMEMQLDTWVGPVKMKEILKEYSSDYSVFGDVYIKSAVFPE